MDQGDLNEQSGKKGAAHTSKLYPQESCPGPEKGMEPLARHGPRRQTAPTDRDLFVVKEMQRRISALRLKAIGSLRGSSYRLRSLPTPTSNAPSTPSTPCSSSTRPHSSHHHNGSTSAVEERVRSLLDAAKRWATARTNSVELAVAWASEDELDAEDDSFSMGPTSAGTSSFVDSRGVRMVRRQPQLPGVEHWGDILNSVAPATGRNEAPLASIRLAASGKGQRSVGSPNRSAASTNATAACSAESPLAVAATATSTNSNLAPIDTTDGAAVGTVEVEPRESVGAATADSAVSSDHLKPWRNATTARRPTDIDSGSSSDEESPEDRKKRKARHGWDIIRKTVYAISPFLRIYRSKVGWVQIAGHCGSFLPGDVNGTILKRETPRELKAFQQLQDDSLAKFVPTFYQSVAVEGSGTYLRMQDLLADMQAPIVMDVKMGTRTYLEDEIKPGEKPSYRSDLYKKMISVDASAPTEEEKERKGITKARYMQFREQMSSSATLGFRIDGIKLQTGLPMRDFKSVREECDVENRFLQYLHGNTKLWANCLHELTAFRLACSDSNFLKNHEVIGSSLLFVGEPETGNAGVWMIDFGKTCELHEEIGVDHFSQWEVGNHEDGYLHGLDNLIRIWIGLHDRVVETAFEEALSKGAQTTTTLTNGVAPEGECLKSECPQDQSPQGESPQGESPQLSTVQEAQETPPPAAAATEPNSPSPCTSSES